ncbi:MAG: hypothetical protein HQL59_05400 [Magnetococcales bacterium]|nr:hypothetical protein [Magnetococcales bacterium]
MNTPVDNLAGRQVERTGDTGYMTALAFCRREARTGGYLKTARTLETLAADKCRQLGIRPGREPNALWGWINIYPLEVLQECRTAMDRE